MSNTNSDLQTRKTFEKPNETRTEFIEHIIILTARTCNSKPMEFQEQRPIGHVIPTRNGLGKENPSARSHQYLLGTLVRPRGEEEHHHKHGKHGSGKESVTRQRSTALISVKPYQIHLIGPSLHITSPGTEIGVEFSSHSPR